MQQLLLLIFIDVNIDLYINAAAHRDVYCWSLHCCNKLQQSSSAQFITFHQKRDQKHSDVNHFIKGLEWETSGHV